MTDQQYVNFHTHSYGSLLDGLPSPKKYAETAAEMGFKALAITDHGNLYCWLDFYDECEKVGVKPILGLEAYGARKTRFDRDEEERAGPSTYEWEQRGPYHLTLAARNKVGYHNLIKLSSHSFDHEAYYVKPRIDHELLATYGEGLIIGSGCLSSEIQQALARGDYDHAYKTAGTYQEIAGKDHFYIEIQDHGIDEQARIKDDLLRLANQVKAPIIPTCDCHYAKAEDHHTHDVMLCIGTKALASDEKRFRFNGPNFHLKSYEEMAKLFPAEWLHNSLVMAERVDFKLERGNYYFPSYPDIPEGETVDSFLEKEVVAGLKRRFGEMLPADVIDRFEYEMRVIKETGFQEYFLVVADIVTWAKDQGIKVGVGRGSVAGSLVAYALRITEVDPLRWNLIFERFLVPGRVTAPDIDIDFDDRYRHKVYEYIKQRYGTSQVANIITFNTVGAKLAIKDAGRVMGYEHRVTDRISKLVPPAQFGFAPDFAKCMASNDFRTEYETNEDSRKIIDTAMGLEGLIRQPGIHAAGIVVTRGPVEDYVPTQRKPNKDGTPGPLVTQWDKDRVEECGILKMDCLSIRYLGVVDMALQQEKDRAKVEVAGVPERSNS